MSCFVVWPTDFDEQSYCLSDPAPQPYMKYMRNLQPKKKQMEIKSPSIFVSLQFTDFMFQGNSEMILKAFHWSSKMT